MQMQSFSYPKTEVPWTTSGPSNLNFRIRLVQLLRLALVFIESITQFEYLGPRIFTFDEPLGCFPEYFEKAFHV
jgi:hypothetical protein